MQQGQEHGPGRCQSPDRVLGQVVWPLTVSLPPTFTGLLSFSQLLWEAAGLPLLLHDEQTYQRKCLA